MEEAQRMYSVVVTGSKGGTIRVSACTPYHAKQLAYAKVKHVQPDITQYKVRPRKTAG